MECLVHRPNTPFLGRIFQNKPNYSCSFSAVPNSRTHKTTTSLFASYNNVDQPIPNAAQESKTEAYNVKFQTLASCKLGISRYPDFEYNAQWGTGTGTGSKSLGLDEGNIIYVDFDLSTLYVPPLTTATTRFLGLPMPPFLRIDIAPETFRGSMNQETGKVHGFLASIKNYETNNSFYFCTKKKE